jgi:hypothetical protein
MGIAYEKLTTMESRQAFFSSWISYQEKATRKLATILIAPQTGTARGAVKVLALQYGTWPDSTKIALQTC